MIKGRRSGRQFSLHVHTSRGHQNSFRHCHLAEEREGLLCFNSETHYGHGIFQKEPNAPSRMSRKFKDMQAPDWALFLPKECLCKEPQGRQSLYKGPVVSSVISSGGGGCSRSGGRGDFQKGILGHTQEHKMGTSGQRRSVCFSKLSGGRETTLKNNALPSARKVTAHSCVCACVYMYDTEMAFIHMHSLVCGYSSICFFSSPSIYLSPLSSLSVSRPTFNICTYLRRQTIENWSVCVLCPPHHSFSAIQLTLRFLFLTS